MLTRSSPTPYVRNYKLSQNTRQILVEIFYTLNLFEIKPLNKELLLLFFRQQVVALHFHKKAGTALT